MRPQGARRNPPATLQRALKMALVTPSPDLALAPDQNLDQDPIEARAGATPALVPARGADARGADLEAPITDDAGAIAVPRCPIGADTSAIGPTQTPVPVWVCLV